VAFFVGVSGVFKASWGRLIGMAVVALIFGWLSFRMRRAEREVLETMNPRAAHSIPPPQDWVGCHRAFLRSLLQFSVFRSSSGEIGRAV
jgi:hypothetical protein